MANNTTITISAVDKTQAAFNSVDRSLKKLQSTSSAVARSVGGLTTALNAAIAAFAIDKLIKFSDAAANIDSRLKLVTSSTQELTRAQSALFKIAQSTGNSFESTVDLYSRLARATASLGTTNTDLEQVTKALSQAITISGSSAASAEAAMIQLGQGFAAGALRGEELNSVLEQTPRVARAIADGLGITVGQLKEFGKEGKLTAEAVFNALKSQSDVLEQEFGKTNQTIAQSFTIVSNSAVRLAGVINEVTGANSSLGGVLRDVASALDDILRADIAFYFENLSAIVKALIAPFANVIDKIGEMIGQGDSVIGFAKVFAAVRLAVELLSASLIFLTDLISGSVIGVAFRALQVTFKTIVLDITNLIDKVMLLDDVLSVAAAAAQTYNPFADDEEAAQGLIQAQQNLASESDKVYKSYIQQKNAISKIDIIGKSTVQNAKDVFAQGKKNIQQAFDNYTNGVKAYEIARKQEKVERAKTESLLNQSSALKEQKKTNLENTKALKEQEALALAKQKLVELAAYEKIKKEVEEITRQLEIQEQVELAQEALKRAAAEEKSLALLEKQSKVALAIVEAQKEANKTISERIQEGAQGLVANDTFQQVAGAAGASGSRAANIAQITAQKGVEQGLLALVLSNEKVQEALTKVFDAIFALIDPIIDALVPVIDALIPVIDAIRPLFEKLIPAVEITAELLAKLIKLIGPLLTLIVKLVEVIEALYSVLVFLTEFAIDSMVKVIERLPQMIFDSITGAFTELPNAIAAAIKDVLPDLGSQLTGGDNSVIGKAVGFVSSGVSSVASALGFKQGGLIPKAQGGMLVGASHSRGGQLINAEGGEYIFSRKAVQSLGAGRLNELNNGVDRNNVVVNIYDETGKRIREYDSAIRVEIKERAARNNQFPAVA
jgi:tape measure domain-containing protein